MPMHSLFVYVFARVTRLRGRVFAVGIVVAIALGWTALAAARRLDPGCSGGQRQRGCRR